MSMTAYKSYLINSVSYKVEKKVFDGCSMDGTQAYETKWRVEIYKKSNGELFHLIHDSAYVDDARKYIDLISSKEVREAKKQIKELTKEKNKLYKQSLLLLEQINCIEAQLVKQGVKL